MATVKEITLKCIARSSASVVEKENLNAIIKFHDEMLSMIVTDLDDIRNCSDEVKNIRIVMLANVLNSVLTSEHDLLNQSVERYKKFVLEIKGK